ncbi:MAG: aminodeoxychorismate/anthranilate synthase component II, partial [Candidatus Caenarcaniphilales bacterium]|nr:aminodeoxychorismate/anthranilate synthase component II [Candidatus Caenarcaniphilales bacterium]
MKTKIFLIDNYDSFTYNLAQYLWELGFDTTVFRNDKISVDEIRTFAPSHIVISPGPGTPADSGVTLEVLKNFHKEIPILGICLGHQCIGEFFGAKVVRAPLPMHGKTSLIRHSERGIFKEVVNPFRVTRYHSLMVEEQTIDPNILEISSWSEDDNLVMGMKHKQYPI